MSLKKHTQKRCNCNDFTYIKKKHFDIEGQTLFQLSHSYLETGHHGYTSDQTFFFSFVLLFA